jgi:hypothetical protein
MRVGQIGDIADPEIRKAASGTGKLGAERKLIGTPGRVHTWGLSGRKVAVSAGPLFRQFSRDPSGGVMQRD